MYDVSRGNAAFFHTR